MTDESRIKGFDIHELSTEIISTNKLESNFLCRLRCTSLVQQETTTLEAYKVRLLHASTHISLTDILHTSASVDEARQHHTSNVIISTLTPSGTSLVFVLLLLSQRTVLVPVYDRSLPLIFPRLTLLVIRQTAVLERETLLLGFPSLLHCSPIPEPSVCLGLKHLQTAACIRLFAA